MYKGYGKIWKIHFMDGKLAVTQNNWLWESFVNVFD
jgi:hypothetical protein